MKLLRCEVWLGLGVYWEFIGSLFGVSWEFFLRAGLFVIFVISHLSKSFSNVSKWPL